MASIEEFLKLLNSDLDKAMSSYAFNVSASLDGDTSKLQACTVRQVSFHFSEPNIISMRGAAEKDKYKSEIWYLPWMINGTAVANLDGKGPQFFSTSQLDGCRFMVEYGGGDRKTAKVLHLAGTVGTGPAGTKERDRMAVSAGVNPSDNSGRVRSYSFGSGVRPKFEKVGKDFKLKYMGNKAWVFGMRDDSGAWYFYAQEMYSKPDTPLGLRDLTA